MHLYYAPAYVVPGIDWETTRKSGWVAASLAERPIAGVEIIAPAPLTREALARAHDPAYIHAVETGAPAWLAGSNGIGWDAELFPAVAASSGGAVEAALRARGVAPARLEGLVSVPEGCGRRLERIMVRETRPAAVNLPTPAVVAATTEMLALVSALGPDDVVIALVSGGGSACLAAPREGVSLEEKIALAQRLSAAGADIATLNAARTRLSRVKGGGLARACTAGRLVALVLSDVIGDDLAVIASGPCVPPDLPAAAHGAWTTPSGCRVSHVVVGSSATAVEAAAAEATRRGYDTLVRHAAAGPAESAEAVGRRLAAEAARLVALARGDGRPRAVVEGGEATVTLPAAAGLGGRNQQTVLAALHALQAEAAAWPMGLVVASVGTDGEDGPTTAAGGIVDAGVAAAAAGHDVAGALARCDAHPLLAACGGLVVTGPTGTNVADVRLILARP